MTGGLFAVKADYEAIIFEGNLEERKRCPMPRKRRAMRISAHVDIVSNT